MIFYYDLSGKVFRKRNFHILFKNIFKLTLNLVVWHNNFLIKLYKKNKSHLSEKNHKFQK